MKIIRIIIKNVHIFQIPIQIVNHWRFWIRKKKKALLNLINEQDSDNLINKTCVYNKDLDEPKYQFLIKKT